MPQDNFLFSTTIKDNISFYHGGITDAEVEQAAKISSIYDNILEFPEGFDTVVGERGVMLSGGQRQRVSIARAIAKNPCILILDDSLSAVDTETEKEIIGNIKNILKHRTGIIISHRVSAVMYADILSTLKTVPLLSTVLTRNLWSWKGSTIRYICHSPKCLTKIWEQKNDQND